MSYFVVFNEFGFNPGMLSKLIFVPYFQHNKLDVYDPSHPTLGNTNLICENNVLKSKDYFGKSTIEKDNMVGSNVDWLFLTDLYQDLRMGYFSNFSCEGNVVKAVTSRFNWIRCSIPQISPISNRYVCYSTEALKYSQSSFFLSIVICQISNYLAIKTRILSIRFQGLGNFFMFFALQTEFIICIVLFYCRPVNNAFGTRDVIFLHFGIYAAFFSIVHNVYDELRKYLIRSFSSKDRENNFFKSYALT